MKKIDSEPARSIKQISTGRFDKEVIHFKDFIKTAWLWKPA